jgi:hypothetical protein
VNTFYRFANSIQKELKRIFFYSYSFTRDFSRSKKVKESSQKIMLEKRNYKINHEKRGVALVINVQKFEGNKLAERKWSIKDVDNLKRTLNYLEFQLVLCEDFTKVQIEQEIQKQASFDHSNADCFLCVVMSHGNDENMFYSSDNREISVEDFMAPIKLCPTLKNKPKLFFFQVCRGENEMEETRVESRPGSADQSTSSGGEAFVDCDQTCSDNETDANTFNTRKKTPISAEADLLVYYATLPNHLAFGTEANGTVLIMNVCDVFYNEAYKNIPNNTKLSQMILKINSKVKEQGWSLADPINRLTKDVHFLPKNVSVLISLYFTKRLRDLNRKITSKKLSKNYLSLSQVSILASNPGKA